MNINISTIKGGKATMKKSFSSLLFLFRM